MFNTLLIVYNSSSNPLPCIIPSFGASNQTGTCNLNARSDGSSKSAVVSSPSSSSCHMSRSMNSADPSLRIRMTVDNRVPYLSAGMPSPARMGKGSMWMLLRRSARSLGGSADRHLELYISQISYRVVSGKGIKTLHTSIV